MKAQRNSWILWWPRCGKRVVMTEGWATCSPGCAAYLCSRVFELPDSMVVPWCAPQLVQKTPSGTACEQPPHRTGPTPSRERQLAGRQGYDYPAQLSVRMT